MRWWSDAWCILYGNRLCDLPITPAGQIIYGICCGLLTGIFRCFGANAEGVSFAIILSNILVPIIEKFTIPRAFGLAKEAKKNE